MGGETTYKAKNKRVKYMMNESMERRNLLRDEMSTL